MFWSPVPTALPRVQSLPRIPFLPSPPAIGLLQATDLSDCPWTYLFPWATLRRALQRGQSPVTSLMTSQSAYLQEPCVRQVAVFPVVKKDHIQCVHIVLLLQLGDEVMGCPDEDGDLEQCSVSAMPTEICRTPDPQLCRHLLRVLGKSLHCVVSPGAAQGVACSVG